MKVEFWGKLFDVVTINFLAFDEVGVIYRDQDGAHRQIIFQQSDIERKLFFKK